MKQQSKAEKRTMPTSADWDRHRMNETHRKGKRGAKKVVRRARRRAGKEATK